MKRYLIVLIGTSKGIGEDLNDIADDKGVHFVDGKGLFLGTFHSHLEVSEIEELLSHRPAFMLFDITNPSVNAINLPTKYYTGLFPEAEDMTDILGSVVKKEVEANSETNKKDTTEEYESVDEILDKLSRNNYDRSCLTKKELKILAEQ